MSAKLAKLIKEARTNAGYSQQGLADKIPGLSAADIGKAERNEKEPTQEQLKAIAKVTGVTQKSLLEAASKASTAKKSTAKSSSSKTSSTAKKTTAKTTSTGTTMKLSAAEKRLVELYRNADADSKKAALKALKGEETEINEILSSLLEGALGSFLK